MAKKFNGVVNLDVRDSVADWTPFREPPAPEGAAVTQPRVSDPSAAPELASGTGSDPLTTSELAKARTVAVTPQLAANARNVAGEAGPEYLSAELDLDRPGRQAEVYFYDYQANKLIKQVVDLKTGKLAKSFSADSMQLPATQPEVDAALDLLLADPAAADLKDAYKKATGKEFAGKDGLTVNAHVFKARAADPTVKQCGKHRCLQLVVETPDGLFIDVHQIIVDLSGRKIARLS